MSFEDVEFPGILCIDADGHHGDRPDVRIMVDEWGGRPLRQEQRRTASAYRGSVELLGPGSTRLGFHQRSGEYHEHTLHEKRCQVETHLATCTRTVKFPIAGVATVVVGSGGQRLRKDIPGSFVPPLAARWVLPAAAGGSGRERKLPSR